MRTIFKRIIIIVIVVGVFALLCFVQYRKDLTYYNDEMINGNTIGNLYGNGLFCENDGLVYFVNPNDDNSLYSMATDESNIQKICDDRVYFINADDHYIYYSRDNNTEDGSQMSFLKVSANALCRIDKDGTDIKILDDAVCNASSLSQNTLYYYHYDTDTATTLYSVGIDGEDKTQVKNTSADPRCMTGDKLYYSGTVSEHNLHKLDVSTGSDSIISTNNCYFPIVVGDNVYYMDLDNNNRVSCMSLSDGSSYILSSYATSAINVYGNYLYYQSIYGEPDGLYRINLTDGSEELLAEGQFNSINVTSKYIYFKDFFSGAIYHMPLSGGPVSVFNPEIDIEE